MLLSQVWLHLVNLANSQPLQLNNITEHRDWKVTIYKRG